MEKFHFGNPLNFSVTNCAFLKSRWGKINDLRKTRCYEDIRKVIELARKRVATAIGSVMVETYWQIGRTIVEEEQQGKDKAVYGI